MNYLDTLYDGVILACMNYLDSPYGRSILTSMIATNPIGKSG